MNSDIPNLYYDGEYYLIFHKSPLVEMIASLHGLSDQKHEKSDSLVLAEGRFKKMDITVRKSLETYGCVYGNWLLIMDLATYASSRIYKDTGRADCTFEEAMAELRKTDDATYLYFFLGMPAFGFSLEDAQRWLRNPEAIEKRALRLVGQYISQKNIIIFIKNIKTLRRDLEELLFYYWNHAFKDVWDEIEKSISKAIRVNRQRCQLLGGVIPYLSSFHSDVYVTKGQIFIKKDVAYIIPLDEIKEVHVYSSTFSSLEILMDKYGSNLVIYFNINLKQINDDMEAPDELMDIVRALSDSNRLKILRVLNGAPSTTQYLSKVMGLAASTVSNHLKILKQAGIVDSKTIKKFVYYEVKEETIAALSEALIKYINED